mmetsp:Transcript_36652/g.87983  ORF Transcript_36652/g.87983 Transcript_36652/m.87983 type:complete len:190 (+) Transcript_36652:58-627(+)
MPLLLIGMSTLLFVPGLHHRVVMRQPLRSGGAGIGMASEEATPSPLSMDVSDLGVTMDDLKAPISDVMDVEASGCESTSRISPDSGCVWSETASRMEVTLTIPGLLGQPAGSLAVEMTETTATITAFGRAVWSCVLLGLAVPASARTEVEPAAPPMTPMQPVVRLTVDKAESGRWGGLIKQIGEDSLIQ